MESKRFADTNGGGGGGGEDDDGVTETDGDEEEQQEEAAAAAAARGDRDRSSENECRVGADGKRQCSATSRRDGACNGKPSWTRRIALGLLAAAVIGGIAWTIYSHWFAKPTPAAPAPAPAPRPLLASGPAATPAAKVAGATSLPAPASPAQRRPLPASSRAPRRVASALPNETSAESRANPDEDDDDDDDGRQPAATESKSCPTIVRLPLASQMATARGQGGRVGAREPIAASSGNRTIGGATEFATKTTTIAATAAVADKPPASVCLTCAQCRHQATYDVRDVVEFARRQSDVTSSDAKKRDPKRPSSPAGAGAAVADAAHAGPRIAPAVARVPVVAPSPPPEPYPRRPEGGSIARAPKAAPAPDTRATVAAHDDRCDKSSRSAKTGGRESPSTDAGAHAIKDADDEEQHADDDDDDDEAEVESPSPSTSASSSSPPPPPPPEEVKLSADETRAVVCQKLVERLPDYASATMENITAFSRELFAQRHRLAKLPDAEALAIVKAHVAPWGVVESKVALGLMWKCKSNLADEFERQLAYDEAVAKIRLEKLRLAKLQEA